MKRDNLFRELYDRYYGSIVAFFVRMGFSRENARELAQDVFVRVYQGLDHYRGDSEWGYLQSTARRLALNELRRRSASKRLVIEESLENLPYSYDSWLNPFTGEQPKLLDAELLERELEKEQRKHLSEEIAKLPKEIRRCLLLSLGGLKYREISDVMQVSLDTVKSRLNEARNILRSRLKEREG